MQQMYTGCVVIIPTYIYAFLGNIRFTGICKTKYLNIPSLHNDHRNCKILKGIKISNGSIILNVFGSNVTKKYMLFYVGKLDYLNT